MSFPFLMEDKMKVNIGGAEVELNFGIRFVRELDKKSNTVIYGKNFGTGIEENVPAMLLGYVDALANIIAAATWAVKPTQEAIDEYIDSVEDIDALIDEVLGELKKQNATAKRTMAAVAGVDAQLKKAPSRQKNVMKK